MESQATTTNNNESLLKSALTKDEKMPLTTSKTWWKEIHTSLGFSKGYNLPLFIIMAGAMLGFSLARLEYLDVSGHFAQGASPGVSLSFQLSQSSPNFRARDRL